MRFEITYGDTVVDKFYMFVKIFERLPWRIFTKVLQMYLSRKTFGYLVGVLTKGRDFILAKFAANLRTEIARYVSFYIPLTSLKK